MEQFVAIADYVPVDGIIFSISQPVYVEQFVAIADYVPVDDVEMGLREGDIVEVLKTGSTGWCLAHHLTTNEEGWVPGTYLDPVPNTGPRSYVSMSSIGEYPGVFLTYSDMPN